MNKRRVNEFDLLELFTAEMEREGINHKLVRLDVDSAVAERRRQSKERGGETNQR